jgi:hypothetical protein
MFLFLTTVKSDDCTLLTNNNKNYYFCRTLKSRDNAQSECVEKGGNLLTISDTTESTWIYNNRASTTMTSDVWIGLKSSNNIVWVWPTGETGYKNWNPFTPNGIRIPNCAR